MNTKEVAAALYRAYTEGDYEIDDTAQTWTFQLGTLRITCASTVDAVLAVCRKYRTGLPRRGLTGAYMTSRTGQPRGGRPVRPVKEVFLRFFDDGEYENALAYLDLFPAPARLEFTRRMASEMETIHASVAGAA